MLRLLPPGNFLIRTFQQTLRGATEDVNPVICNACFFGMGTQNASLRALPLSLLTRQTLLINIKMNGALRAFSVNVNFLRGVMCVLIGAIFVTPHVLDEIQNASSSQLCFHRQRFWITHEIQYIRSCCFIASPDVTMPMTVLSFAVPS